jgi:hypothetical protein
LDINWVCETVEPCTVNGYGTAKNIKGFPATVAGYTKKLNV